MPQTSVVIRTFNEERHLPALLDALERQTYRDFGTVVVDSGSTDLTCEIAAQRADRLLQIDSRDFTFGFSLNVGIAANPSDFVAIISAHAIPASDQWLERLVSHLQASDAAMVYGAQQGVPESKYSEYQDFRRTFQSDGVRRSPHLFGNNANSAIRRDRWEEHPFDVSLPGLEDLAWAKYWIERGHRVSYEPDAVVLHIHAESWRQLRWRYHREAGAARAMGIKTPRSIPGEIGREVGYLVGDLARATFEGQITQRGAEIALYRFNKALGTSRGLLDGSFMMTTRQRDAALFNRFAKAAVIRGPGKIGITEVPIPEVKPGDLLVKVAYAGICATDLEILDGKLGYFKSGLASYPIIPGHEFAGRVVRAGSNAPGWRVGDGVVVECVQSCGRCAQCLRGNTVACPRRAEVGVLGKDGGFAEYFLTPARFAHRLPARVSLRLAVAIEPLAVALKGLRRLERAWGAHAGPRRCAAVGGGPIGYLVAQVLAKRGHGVTIFDRDPRRRALVQGDRVAVGDDLSQLGSFEAVIEATGAVEALQSVLEHTAAGTAVLALGLPYGKQEFNFEDIVAFDKTVVGSVGSGAEDFAEAVDLVGKLDLDPLLQRVMPFEQLAEALQESRSHRHLKVLLAIDPLLDTLGLGEQAAERDSGEGSELRDIVHRR